MKNPISFITFCICSTFILLISFFYYPKWQKPGTEATLSWDVSGYYMYLPAIFIYKDLKEYDFLDGIIKKYKPTPENQQVYRHPSGNRVMKYACGQAVLFFPFFTIAHLIATFSEQYEPDGFSPPYQLLISIGSLAIAIIGLFFLLKILRCYFNDKVTAITIFCIVFGTNYLNYSAIDGAMTHNNLFTIYALLIFTTIRFYGQPTIIKSLLIGGLVGLATLTRPTEVISCLIPICWGVNLFSKESIISRLTFFYKHSIKVFVACLSCVMIGGIQLVYWKYVTGEWLVYSYGDQGFSWLHPHIMDGLFSYKSGWLVYSPIMIFSLLGFLPLYRFKKEIWFTTILFTLLFIYIAFAWDIWWYGGSLGQRTMVQAYPILAIPFAAFIRYIDNSTLKMAVVYPCFAIFIYHNLWLTHQAHRGGLIHVGQMTQAYFWKVLGTYRIDENNLKLLDTKDEFNGQRKDIRQIYSNNFEDTPDSSCVLPPIEGNYSLCLSVDRQRSPTYFAPLSNGDAEWVRASATFKCNDKEWDFWKMTHFIVAFYDQEEIVKQRKIRIYRLLKAGETKSLYFDTKVPNELFDRIGVHFWNAEGNKPIVIDDLKIESFNEERTGSHSQFFKK